MEDDDYKEVFFNDETLTFTLQLVKIWNIKWAFKNLVVTAFALEEDIDLL